ncbi:phage integrase SAM-like domain-containing protein [Bacteroides ovatus]|uniref:Phage integrase family protein n=1 Tax=Bacteroides ovatus TaxID=28116 RepID=A0A1G8JRD4_BACOV|nr:phage integrase SAM-like domain-containing protein [Bacteroides ovatus]SDI33752.1 Phage integrase family protein [Bacteroides ovatus]
MQQQVFINDMRANFNLRRPKGDKPTNIYFVVRVGKRQLKLSTGVKVYPDHWNVRKQEAYISVRLSELDNLNNTIVNDKLEELKMNFAEYKQYLCDHPSELDRGVELLKKYVYKNNIMESQGLVLNPISWLEENIKEDANLTNTGRNSTKNQYLSYLKKFSKFLEVKGIEIKTFEEINSKLLSSFRDYLANDYVFIKKGKETHLKRDYINSLIIILITILKRAVEAGLLENHKYVDIVVKPLVDKEDDENEIYLRDEEVLLLYNYKPLNERDEMVKDLFILNCVTGQRISDTEKLDDVVNNVSGIDYITLVQRKTGKKVSFSLVFELAKEILVDKYNYQLPECKDYLINRHIKRIAKEAGITGTEIIQEHRGSDSDAIQLIKERSECITTHTGRRTFISLLKLRGWDSTKIQRYSGHKDMQMVEKYCKLKDIDYELYERNKRLYPDKLLKLVSETDYEGVLEQKSISQTIIPCKQKVKVLDYLFKEATLLKLQEYQKNGINIYKLKETVDVINAIKDIKRIDKVKVFLEGIDKTQLYERVNVLEPIIYKIARHNLDIVLYQLFQQKVVELKLSDSIKEVTEEDRINELWAMDYADKELEFQDTEPETDSEIL